MKEIEEILDHPNIKVKLEQARRETRIIENEIKKLFPFKVAVADDHTAGEIWLEENHGLEAELDDHIPPLLMKDGLWIYGITENVLYFKNEEDALQYSLACR